MSTSTALVPVQPLYRKLVRVCTRCGCPWSYKHVCHDRVRSRAFDSVLKGLREIEDLGDEAQPHIERMRGFSGYGDVVANVDADDHGFWRVFCLIVHTAQACEVLDPIDRFALEAILDKAGRLPPWKVAKA